MPSLIQAFASVGVDYNAYAYHCAFPLVVATVEPGWAYIHETWSNSYQQKSLKSIIIIAVINRTNVTMVLTCMGWKTIGRIFNHANGRYWKDNLALTVCVPILTVYALK